MYHSNKLPEWTYRRLPGIRISTVCPRSAADPETSRQQVCAPIANILGQYNLFNKHNLSDPINAEIMLQLKIATVNLDAVVKTIVMKTNEINPQIR